MINSNKGITLLTLTITVVIMLIVTFTVSVNVSTYVERKKITNLETDIIKLKEEIDYYYSKNNELPIINKYTNTTMLEKSTNDNENYFIIDLLKMRELNLNYGKDYKKIIDYTIEISELTDIYIINEQSHTIYYPNGIKYNEKMYYTTIDTKDTLIEDITLSSIEITGKNVGKVNEQIQLTADLIPSFVKNTGVIWSSEDETLAIVDENGKVTLKSVGTVTITATSKDNTQLTDTHEITIQSDTVRYVLIDVYDHLGYNAASISELEIYDENGDKIQYNVLVSDVYDSVTKSKPTYWEDERYWNYTNLYDGEVNYTSNTEGGQNCTVFIWKSDAGTDNYARFIVDLEEEKIVRDIKIFVGDMDTTLSNSKGGRTPVSVSAYKVKNYSAHDTNSISSTYYNNVAQRNNEGLNLLGTVEFTTKVTTATGYSLIK